MHRRTFKGSRPAALVTSGERIARTQTMPAALYILPGGGREGQVMKTARTALIALALIAVGIYEAPDGHQWNPDWGTDPGTGYEYCNYVTYEAH